MGDVSANFLVAVARQFPLPKGAQDDPGEWSKDYIDAMEHYTDSLLALAAKRIIKERDVRSFPLVAECVRACRDTMEAMSEPDLRRPIRHADDPWTLERRARADKMFQCEMGREAVKDGWGWALWDWLRENSRYPNPAETEVIRKNGMSNTKDFWKMAHNPPKVKNPHFSVDVKKLIAFHQIRHDKLRKLIEAM